MTTRVTVDAHAGWDVEVVVVNTTEAGEEVSSKTEVVPKLTAKDFYIHGGMKLGSIKELKNGG